MRSRAVLALVLAVVLAIASAPATLAAPATSASATALAIGPQDTRIEARADGGYDLYVRAKPGLSSILLTESTKDPAMKADNFAYRAADYNEVNGDEKRLLDGKPLPSSSRLYSLISSTPVPDPAFGMAFRVLVPPVLVYGYAWSRSGTVAVGEGTYINIRAFALPYADYAGAFRDNPYSIVVSARPLAPPATAPAPPPPQVEAPPPPKDDSTSAKLAELIDERSGKSLDLVVCLDTTQSMEPYIDDIKKNLGPMLRERSSGFARFRIGVVLFKDYWPDDYITRKYPFTSDIAAFERTIKSVSVGGGMDIPEAEYEALFAAATEFDWSADQRQVILVTDAPPHPDPRGKILFSDVIRESKDRRLEADAIVEPTTMTPPIPVHAEDENEARRLAQLPAGATHRIETSALSLGAFTETVSRLLDAATGKELSRDVVWRARSSGVETVFINGVRVK